jgi:RNA polymerase sigma-70 factor (ECF subfamily)
MAMQFRDFDRSYMDRLRSGDPGTEEHFVAYFGKLIRMKVGQRLHSTAALEDVQQETFARVLWVLTEGRMQQPERLGAFVHSVCSNVLREHCRSAWREVPADDGFVDNIPDPAIGVCDAIATRQMQEEVREVLDELSEKDRRLMKALFLEERDKDDVCRDFGVDREHLRVLVYRAKQSFKSHYVQATRKEQERASSAGRLPSSRRTHRGEPAPALVH